MLILYASFLVFFFPITEAHAEEKHFDLNFLQNDYKLNFEWGEVVRYNKRRMKEFRSVVFKYNRTCTAANLTFEYNFDIGNKLELIIQAYKFASNKYRLFPLRLQVNYCEAVVANLVGGHRIMNCGNFTGCPVLKNKRNHICNFTPDPFKFLPFIPNGRYKLEIQGVYHSEEMFVLNVMGEVYRPFL